VERLYLPRSEGGRGLINVENFFHHRLVVLSHHLFSSNDVLVQLRNQLDSLLPPHLSGLMCIVRPCVLMLIGGAGPLQLSRRNCASVRLVGWTHL